MNNIFGKVKLALKHVAKALNPISRRTKNSGRHMFNGGPDVTTMAANHFKTNSTGLQLQAECWYEQEELPEA